MKKTKEEISQQIYLLIGQASQQIAQACALEKVTVRTALVLVEALANDSLREIAPDLAKPDRPREITTVICKVNKTESAETILTLSEKEGAHWQHDQYLTKLFHKDYCQKGDLVRIGKISLPSDFQFRGDYAIEIVTYSTPRDAYNKLYAIVVFK